MANNEITIAVIETSVRAVIICGGGNYALTTARVVLIRMKDGTYMSSYPDYTNYNGKTYRLDRVDRVKNYLVFKNGSSNQ